MTPAEHPHDGEALTAFSRRLWAEVDPADRAACVQHLRSILSTEDANEWREEIERDPDGWIGPHHMFAGMGFRNVLRDVLSDAILPTGNWDDYYTAAVEDAVLGEYRP